MAALLALGGLVAWIVIPSSIAVSVEEAPSKARITIEFAAPPARWRSLGDNHPVSARITTATIDNVLKLSAKALIPGGQQIAVFVIQEGRARKHAITLRARDADTLVVESGLKENDSVIMSPGPNIKDGVRVKRSYKF